MTASDPKRTMRVGETRTHTKSDRKLANAAFWRPRSEPSSANVCSWLLNRMRAFYRPSIPQGFVARKFIPTVPNALALDACGAPSKTSAFQVISKSVKPAATTVD